MELARRLQEAPHARSGSCCSWGCQQLLNHTLSSSISHPPLSAAQDLPGSTGLLDQVLVKTISFNTFGIQEIKQYLITIWDQGSILHLLSRAEDHPGTFRGSWAFQRNQCCSPALTPRPSASLTPSLLPDGSLHPASL